MSRNSYCEAEILKVDGDINCAVIKAYNEIFGYRVANDRCENNHGYNQLMPDYYNDNEKEHVIKMASKYFDDCERIASMGRVKFLESVVKQFEREKVSFDKRRNRDIIDLLDSLPEKMIRGYLDMKGS